MDKTPAMAAMGRVQDDHGIIFQNRDTEATLESPVARLLW